jgi:anaerobic selenocysteine-containing dehydrogenase
MNWTQLKKAVIAPLHDSRPDLEIIFDLADRLRLGEHFFDGDIEAAWNHHLEPAGLTVQQLRDNPVGLSADTATVYRKYSEKNPKTGRTRGFPTPSGRIELHATRFAEEGYSPLPVYGEPADSPLDDTNATFPLVLTSFRSIQFVGPQHRNIPRLRAANPEPCMELHPETARAAGIEEGQWARIETAVGKIRMKVEFNANLHPRVVCAPYGWWQECKELGLPGYDPFGPDGANVNLLIPNAYIDPISAAVPHRSRMCRVTHLDST